jgi:uncharacterized protein YodC (DUF2158 family)
MTEIYPAIDVGDIVNLKTDVGPDMVVSDVKADLITGTTICKCWWFDVAGTGLFHTEVFPVQVLRRVV